MSSKEQPSLDSPPAGAIRFNTDSSKLEIYSDGTWWNINSTSPEEQTGGTRAIIHIGYKSSARSDVIEYLNIETFGNSVDFGDLTVDRSGTSGASSRVRGLWTAGYGPNASVANVDTIDYVTISSTGDAVDFGNLTYTQRDGCGLSNQTRGIISGGGYDTINYVTISSTGDAVDFGNLIASNNYVPGAFASSVKGIIGGGYVSSAVTDVIQYIIISTTGDAADFGDLRDGAINLGGCSNSTRGVFVGGATPSSSDVIQYVTISSNGNALDFGDLNGAARESAHGTSSPTRGIFSGGWPGSSALNQIDCINIPSRGNAVDFGRVLTAGWTGSSISNGHGGL